VTVLDLGSFGNAEGYAIDDAKVVGIGVEPWDSPTPFLPRAALWSPFDSAISLLEPSLQGGFLQETRALSIDGDAKVGFISLSDQLGTRTRATLWQGAVNTRVDLDASLDPTEWRASRALDVSGTSAVGFAEYPAIQGSTGGNAFLWDFSGSQVVAVDLNPTHPTYGIAYRSGAYGVSGTEKVGSAEFLVAPLTYQSRPGLWNHQNQWVDLMPPVAESGAAIANHGGIQVGSVSLASSDQASMWFGTAASWVNIAPGSTCFATGTESRALAVHNGDVVGLIADFPAFWRDHPDTPWVDAYDLNESLPAGVVGTMATGIWHDEDGVSHVVGFGVQTDGFDSWGVAILWVGNPDTGPTCEYDFNSDGNVDLLDAQQMAAVFTGTLQPSPCWRLGDLNQDEVADLTDAQILATYVTTGFCPF
jgi:hypothetical protein